jgi:predicted glycosyltransferase
MKILFALNHPAHYHLFKYSIKELINRGNNVIITIKEKDVLENLLNSDGVPYNKINKKHLRKGFVSILSKSFIELLSQDFKLNRLIKKNKPDILVGTDVAITHVGALNKITSIVLNEDDFEVNKLFCAFSYPFASYILSPSVCNVGRFQHKKISYSGYQKLAYLHPKRFIPDKTVVNKYINSKRYFLIRLVSLTAGHDIEKKHKGINDMFLLKIIQYLSNHGSVYITSERDVSILFKKYQLKIDPVDIHHIMYYSSLFISDSQSMSVEAAVLGVPSIRFSSFAGKISVLEELENKYKLTFGIHPDNPETLMNRIEQLLSMENLRKEFAKRRKKMLSDKIDLTVFMVWFIENYPESVEIMKKTPDYQYNFK